MINKNAILFTILIGLAISARSQFSIDVYGGYNQSSEVYTLPVMYNVFQAEVHYGNTPIDTIYNSFYPDSIINVRYNILSNEFIYEPTAHNFASGEVLGLSMFYRYFNYFETGLSFEKSGITDKYRKFEILNFDNRFGYDERLFYYSHDSHYFKYDIYAASLTQKVLYPYKKISLSASFSLMSYYSLIKYSCIVETKSMKDEMYYYDFFEANLDKKHHYSGYSFGFRVGLGISYNFFKNLSVFTNVSLTKANLKFQERYLYDYYSENVNDSGVYVTSQPDPAEINSRFVAFREMSYDSWSFRLGLRYTFGNK
jgi:hypothetical protein